MIRDTWLQLIATVPSEVAESLGALLIELGSLGCIENQHTNNKTDITSFFSEDLSAGSRENIELLAQNFSCSKLVWGLQKDDGWSTNWKAFFKPTPIGDSFLICPVWEEPEPFAKQHTILIEPGMAFGTGQHATTASCILMLEKHFQYKTILDVGTGSGILAVAAALLGATSILGIDNDVSVIQIAQENATLNEVADRCRFTALPLSDVEDSYPFVVANIQAHILIALAKDLLRCCSSQGYLLLSGILHEKRDNLVEHFEGLGCKVEEDIEQRNWHTILFRTK